MKFLDLLFDIFTEWETIEG